MKNFLPLAVFLNAFIFVQAQEYLTGTLIDRQGYTRAINYDRTENAIGAYLYQSEYKVLSKAGNLLYTITLTHDQLRSMFSVALKTEGSNVKGAIIEYDENECGLIFSDLGNTETAFDLSKPYNYLLSFTDVNRDYPVLHKIKAATGEQIVLDPLNKFCLKKHLEIVKSNRVTQYIAQKAKKTDDDANNVNNYKGDLWGDKNANSKTQNLFASQLLKEKDSLYTKNNWYTQAVNQLRAGMDKDIKDMFKDNRPKETAKKYAGEKKKGKPDGNGVLADTGNIYDGKFEKGGFLSGIAIIKRDSAEYLGQYSSGFMNGAGMLKYKNGGYLLGKFKNGKLADGIILAKDKDGEIFFGNYLNNQRTGYAELRSPGGTCYYGEFRNGRLIKGYSKEVDQFGYSTYSKIENGTKKTIDPQQARYFFAEVANLKK